MIQKEKYNVKRVLALILSLACVTGLLAGCARQNAGETVSYTHLRAHET